MLTVNKFVNLLTQIKLKFCIFVLCKIDQIILKP